MHGATPGLYIEFESQPGEALALTSLEDKSQGIELVAVTNHWSPEETPRRIERATVFVPEGKVKHFFDRFEKYAKTEPKQKREQRHEAMLDPIATLRLATLRSLWTDTDATYPLPGEKIWWEVWLRRHGGNELQRLMELAGLLQLEVADNRLQFEDRIVTLVGATLEQLSTSIDVLDDIAELRRAKETAKFFIDDLPPHEQGEWAADLLRRTSPPRADSPVVCILDTGVTRGHALLTAALAAEDCHAYKPQWKTDDHDGHGTEMAGLALYGDLTPRVASSAPIQLRHRLESVKILPPEGKNRPQMYGAITAEATSRVEIQRDSRQRCFSMSVGALDGRDLGQPTSWSAAVDALAAGRAFDPNEQGLIYLDDGVEPSRRLFLLSAGNVDGAHLQEDHLARCDVEVVHDPGQAWNALTVGAFTEKVNIQDPVWQGWSSVAQRGELSPWSATGVAFDEDWPIKPEVVFEGGNVAKDAKGKTSFPCPDLSLLSTYFVPAHRSFELTWATSAATPQVARMASLIWADYPTLWPEAVRALIVHSAEWTAPMRARLQAVSGKRKKVPLLCRYGYGVPQIDRALRSSRWAKRSRPLMERPRNGTSDKRAIAARFIRIVCSAPLPISRSEE